MNQLELGARVLECGPVRHTPAGFPVLEMLLAHVSEVMEAGLPRRVELTVSAVALGDLALLLADMSLGSDLHVKGFLAPMRKNSTKLRLHLQWFRNLSRSLERDAPGVA
jgi:primosomal replication protein N